MRSIILITMMCMTIYCASSQKCQSPYEGYNGKCVWVNTQEKKTVSEAQTKCLMGYPKGKLATHIDDRDKKYIYTRLAGGAFYVWVGAGFSKPTWSDGTLADNLGDIKGHEQGKCIYTDGQTYGAKDCNEKLGFVCYAL
ncbi:SWPV1-305 [Shearwaterpox virus]|uniref:SWPV1-005 n=1 Tax=Shearwaterpox virus TaxID=1974596 RepID=A0A1V0S7L9_CNPV|nr:SWPV1-005 [Shearwaterpox virus]ARF02864.1 SWPV1-305 [Shearwaterpox virus]